MGFGLPWALLGLMAAGAPVLVHLIRRRDLRDVVLPTVVLLRRARAQSRRRLRLVDLLLLLARILLIALVAFAVSQPYLTVSVAWGDGSVASAAIIVDDSMSMAREESGTTRLDKAVERARDALDSLPRGSEVAVIRAGKPARVLVRRTDDLETALRSLDRLPAATGRGTDLAGALRLATRELAGARHQTRRLLVLSDFARHVRTERAPWPSGNVDVRVERIGDHPEMPNRAVTEAIAVPDPNEPDKASVRVTVREFAPDEPGTAEDASVSTETEDGDAASVELSLTHRGEEVARDELQISEGLGRAKLDAPLPDEGDPTARIALEGADDALAIDDRRGVLLRPGTGARVLLVNGDPRASSRDDEISFVTKALDAAPRDEGTIRYRIIDPGMIDARVLANVDVVLLANVPTPSARTAELLSTFVKRGGGLLVAAGDQVDARAYAGRLDALLPVHPGPARVAPNGDPVKLARPEDERAGEELVPSHGLTGASFRKRLLLEEPGPGARVPLRFEDGVPALVVGSHGDGHVGMLATTVDDDWTDLPYRPGFLPLLVGTLRHLAPAARMPSRPFEPGETVSLPVPPGAEHMRILTPDDDVHDIGADALAKDEIEFADTSELGSYRVQVTTEESGWADVPRAAFVVAPPVEESDLTPGHVPDMKARPRTAGTGVARRPLAPWLFLLAGLLGIGEALLRRYPGSRRNTDVELPVPSRTS